MNIHSIFPYFCTMHCSSFVMFQDILCKLFILIIAFFSSFHLVLLCVFYLLSVFISLVILNFFSFVSGVFIVACWRICMMAILKPDFFKSQMILKYLKSQYCHLLFIFSHANWNFLISWYDEWFSLFQPGYLGSLILRI